MRLGSKHARRLLGIGASCLCFPWNGSATSTTSYTLFVLSTAVETFTTTDCEGHSWITSQTLYSTFPIVVSGSIYTPTTPTTSLCSVTTRTSSSAHTTASATTSSHTPTASGVPAVIPSNTPTSLSTAVPGNTQTSTPQTPSPSVYPSTTSADPPPATQTIVTPIVSASKKWRIPVAVCIGVTCLVAVAFGVFLYVRRKRRINPSRAAGGETGSGTFRGWFANVKPSRTTTAPGHNGQQLPPRPNRPTSIAPSTTEDMRSQPGLYKAGFMEMRNLDQTISQPSQIPNSIPEDQAYDGSRNLHETGVGQAWPLRTPSRRSSQRVDRVHNWSPSPLKIHKKGASDPSGMASRAKLLGSGIGYSDQNPLAPERRERQHPNSTMTGIVNWSGLQLDENGLYSRDFRLGESPMQPAGGELSRESTSRSASVKLHRDHTLRRLEGSVSDTDSSLRSFKPAASPQSRQRQYTSSTPRAPNRADDTIKWEKLQPSLEDEEESETCEHPKWI